MTLGFVRKSLDERLARINERPQERHTGELCCMESPVSIHCEVALQLVFERGRFMYGIRSNSKCNGKADS